MLSVVSVFMTYFDNPGGMIPAWLVNWAAKVRAECVCAPFSFIIKNSHMGTFNLAEASHVGSCSRSSPHAIGSEIVRVYEFSPELTDGRNVLLDFVSERSSSRRLSEAFNID